MRRHFLLAAVAGVAGLVLPACGATDPEAATVNGTVIERAEFEELLDAYHDNERYISASPLGRSVRGEGAGSVTGDFARAMLREQITYAIVEQEVADRGLTVTDALHDEAVTLTEGSHRLTAEYTDNSGTREMGTVVAMTGALVLGLSGYASYNQAGERSDPALGLIGGAIGIVISVAGIAMTLTSDTAVIRVDPSARNGERWSGTERRRTARAESGFGPF